MNTEIKETLEAIVIKGGNLGVDEWNKVHKLLADLGSDLVPMPSADMA